MSEEIEHKIVNYDMESKDTMTELGQILFVNCLWGERIKAEAIAYYLKSMGYHRDS